MSVNDIMRATRLQNEMIARTMQARSASIQECASVDATRTEEYRAIAARATRLSRDAARKLKTFERRYL